MCNCPMRQTAGANPGASLVERSIKKTKKPQKDCKSEMTPNRHKKGITDKSQCKTITRCKKITKMSNMKQP